MEIGENRRISAMSLAHPPVDCGPYRIHSLQEVSCGTAYPKPPARTGHPVDILYVTASGGRLVCGGRTDTLKLGTAVICTAGEYSLQSEDAACPLRFFHLRLSFHPVSPQDETAQMAEALTREPVRILHDLYRLHGVFTALFDELETEEMYRSRLIESLLHQLAVYLYRGSLPESPVRSGPEIPDLVSAIRDCLGRHILYMRHVGELEERLCYSYPHLSRRYRQETGRSLKEDFDLRRMERAAELLLDGVSVSEAAEVLGYQSAAAFSRAFRARMGLPPGTYKDRHKAAPAKEPVQLVFEDFEGPVFEWRTDRVHGSAQNAAFTDEWRYQGTRAGFFDFNVSSDWRVDRYTRMRNTLHVGGMTHLTFWSKATKPVRVQMLLYGSDGNEFGYVVSLGCEAAIISIPLSQFRYTGEADPPPPLILGTGTGVALLFRGLDNLDQPGSGRVYMDRISFTDTDCSEMLETPVGSNLVDVREPDTGIIQSPTVVFRPESMEDINAGCSSAVPPAAVYVRLHEDRTVHSFKGCPLGTLTSFYIKIYRRMMPVFALSSKQAADQLIQYLKERGERDVFVASADAEIVRYVRRQYYLVHGILDRTGGDADPAACGAEANSCLSRIVLLDEDTPQETIDRLRLQSMTVWLMQRTGSGGETVRYHRMLTSGANGLVVERPAGLMEAMRRYPPHILLRAPHIAAQSAGGWIRGENTLESAERSIRGGAEALSLDVYMTRDRRVVATQFRQLADITSYAKGDIEQMDWDEVRKIVIDRYNGEPVPFALQRPLQLLETFFERFADKVPHFFVKIKSPQFGILPVVKKLAEAYRVADRLSYVSHTPQHFLRLRRMSPGASLHNRDFAREETFRLEFPSVLSDVQMFDTVFSPRYHDNPALFDLIRRLRHRGVPSWPYEVSGYDEYVEVFQSGVDGFFSYAPDRSASWMKRLTGPAGPLRLRVGVPAALRADMHTYDGQIRPVDPVVLVLEGDLRAEGSRLTASSPTEGSVVLCYSWTIQPGASYTMATQPIPVTAAE